VIPIGDSPRSTTTPWVNYTLIGINFAVFLYMFFVLSDSTTLSRRNQEAQAVQNANGPCYHLLVPPTDLERYYCRWSFQPREFFDAVGGKLDVPNHQPTWQIYATLITSIFLHAGWLHILGNMLFLWIFGDNVEDRFGHLKYLLFYLLAGIVATLVQGAIDVNSVTPSVGASGAIAGVLGAYLVLYPRATVSVVIPFFILIFIPIPVPAFIMIGLWFLQNLLSGVATLGSDTSAGSGVAFFAHVGGFVFGLAVTLLAAPFLRRPRPAPIWDR
jgi:membrane associated rhomboid family serine protease